MKWQQQTLITGLAELAVALDEGVARRVVRLVRGLLRRPLLGERGVRVREHLLLRREHRRAARRHLRAALQARLDVLAVLHDRRAPRRALLAARVRAHACGLVAPVAAVADAVVDVPARQHRGDKEPVAAVERPVRARRRAVLVARVRAVAVVVVDGGGGQHRGAAVAREGRVVGAELRGTLGAQPARETRRGHLLRVGGRGAQHGSTRNHAQGANEPVSHCQQRGVLD